MLWHMISGIFQQDISESEGNFILVTPNANLGAVLMFVLIELGEQQRLGFLHSDIGGNPAFILRMNNPRAMNAEASEPIHDVDYSFLFRSKHLLDFLSSEVFAISLRVGVGTILVDC